MGKDASLVSRFPRKRSGLGALWIVALVAAILSSGCEQLVPQLERNPTPAVEGPVVNLPPSLRQRNWTGPRGPADGSCVHASMVSHLRWQNKLELAKRWRETYAGGENTYGIREKVTANRLRYAFTESANPAFLDYVHNTRRGAIIWWKPSHCCHFCGWSIDSRGVVWAAILDNNATKDFEYVERSQFLRSWAAYGGFALAVLGDPVPPALYPFARTR